MTNGFEKKKHVGIEARSSASTLTFILKCLKNSTVLKQKDFPTCTLKCVK